MRRARQLLAAAAIALSIAEARVASGQDPNREARELFESAAVLAREGRWRDALTTFERSAALKPHATTTYNLAYCERALGHAARAWRGFGRALDENLARGGQEMSEELARAAAEYREELEPQLAHLDVSVAPPDARITVDGRPLDAIDAGKDRPTLIAGTREPGPAEPVPAARFHLLVDPGLHVVWVAGRTIERRFAPGPGTLALAPDPPAPAAASTVARAPGPRTDSRRTWAYVLGGAGAAGIAAGTIAAALSFSAWQDALDACPARTTCPDDRGKELSTRSAGQAHFATVAFVAGGTALAGAVVLFLTSSTVTR